MFFIFVFTYTFFVCMYLLSGLINGVLAEPFAAASRTGPYISNGTLSLFMQQISVLIIQQFHSLQTCYSPLPNEMRLASTALQYRICLAITNTPFAVRNNFFSNAKIRAGSGIASPLADTIKRLTSALLPLARFGRRSAVCVIRSIVYIHQNLV